MDIVPGPFVLAPRLTPSILLFTCRFDDLGPAEDVDDLLDHLLGAHAVAAGLLQQQLGQVASVLPRNTGY